jgi:type I restriction enzyme S subunit
MNWEKIKLGDIATFSNGVNFSKNAYSKGVKLIGVSDFGNRLLPNYNELEEISADVLKESDYLENGDIIFVRSNGNKELVGRCMLIENLNFPTTYSGFCIRARFNNLAQYNSRFFAYYFKTKLFRKSISGATVGANIQNLNQGLLSNHVASIPNINIQNKITFILSAYDNLIENNNKRIKILEQMAENLYKEWFIRFRFPGHETTKLVASEMGKIPASFNMKKMQDVFEYYIGGGWGNDVSDKDFSEEASVIRGTDFPYVKKGDLSTCPVRYHKASNYRSRKLEDGDIILEVSGGTAEQPVGRTVLVSQQLIDRFNGRVICASFCKLVRLNKKVISPYFFYYWMQFLYNTRIIDRFQLQSTGIINFKFEHFLKKGCVMLPPRDLMEQFERLIIPIHSEIEKLSMHNENLIKQRDLLLPRLMSGKLAV